jgi:sarcosine oxidase, subunit delta
MSFVISCPVCGRRNAYEFRFGGEERGPRPEEEGLTSQSWCDYVHLRTNAGGPQQEWWLHRDGCGLWFTIWRDTHTNLEIDGPEAPA